MMASADDTYQSPWYALSNLFLLYPKFKYILLILVLLNILTFGSVLLSADWTVYAFLDLISSLAILIFADIFYFIAGKKQEFIPDGKHVPVHRLDDLKSYDQIELYLTSTLIVILLSTVLLQYVL